MRNHGSQPKYYHKYVGGNFRLDPIQAVALMVKLPHLDEWSQGRRDNAAYYNEKFAGTVVRTPYISPDCETIYNQYCIRVPRRDEVVAHITPCRPIYRSASRTWATGGATSPNRRRRPARSWRCRSIPS